MKIVRRGLLLDPLKDLPSGYTHASTPFAIPLDENRVRVLFNSRDKANRSYVMSVDYVLSEDRFSPAGPVHVLMPPGDVGAFDDSGVSVGSIVLIGNEHYFYYMGWNLGVTVPWRNSIGIAKYNIARNEITRIRKSPIIDRSEEDPYTLSYPWVASVNSEQFLFYGSNRRWNTEKVDIDHVLKYAVSKDGFHWTLKGAVNFNPVENANAFCRPSLIKVGSKFLMAYAYRGEKYKIGFLQSEDLKHWTNLSSFEPNGEHRWESEEVTYPCFFHLGDRVFLLYCGNKYGLTGFGIAELFQ